MVRATTTGLCIQRGPFSETSQIVQFLTDDLGRIACIAKGAFREKNNYKGNFDLLGLSRLTLSMPRGEGMALLSQGELLEEHARLHKDLKAFAGAALVAELLRFGVPEGQNIHGLFDLACGALQSLDRGRVPEDHVLFAFQSTFLKMLGYEPELDHCTECRLQPAAGNRLAVFPGRGGVVCRRCRPAFEEGLNLSWKASRAVVLGQGADPLQPGFPELAGNLVCEIWAFFELFFQYFLERRINSYAFMKTFQRGSRNPSGG